MKLIKLTVLLLTLLNYYQIHAQTEAKQLKSITSQLKEIAEGYSFFYYENKALNLIKKANEIYDNASDKTKLSKPFDKFLAVESSIKQVVSDKYLSSYERSKQRLLNNKIPEYSYMPSLPKDEAKKLIDFSVQPSIESDYNALIEYENYYYSLNQLYIKASSEMKRVYMIQYDSINSLFKSNQYYKDFNLNFDKFICQSNEKHLQTLKLNFRWIAEHTENKSRPIADITERLNQSKRIANELIGDDCLSGFSVQDTLAKYEERINNFDNAIPKQKAQTKELDVDTFTEQEKMIDCAVANKFLELTGAIETHFSSNKPSTLALISFYKNGLGMEYYRSYREQLTDSGALFYDEILKVIGLIIYDIENGANANRIAGMLLQNAFANADLTTRKEKLCGN